MKLSILIPTVPARRKDFLPKILDNLYEQYDKLSQENQKQVEILVLSDNKTIMLGTKRNIMVDMAQGKYVVFVDDDDRVSDDYISSILEATKEDKDVIVFQSEVNLNNRSIKPCYFSIEYEKNYNTSEGYYRIPNHICAVKKDIASQVEFPPVIYGEDTNYAKVLINLLKTETKIDKVLYYYDYNDDTTETQQNMVWRGERKRRTYVPPILDLIILSDGKTEEMRKYTRNAIYTALGGAKDYPINIIVIESHSEDIEYKDAKTFYIDEPFNYNRFANIGAGLGDAPYIMIANNDLFFQDNWLTELLNVNEDVMSPKCYHDRRQADVLENESGYVVGRNFSGWCFMIKRYLWERIGGFDEDFNFWYADNAVVEQLKKINKKPMLVVNSSVTHLGSLTLRTLDEQTQEEITHGQKSKFDNKYQA